MDCKGLKSKIGTVFALIIKLIANVFWDSNEIVLIDIYLKEGKIKTITNLYISLLDDLKGERVERS